MTPLSSRTWLVLSLGLAVSLCGGPARAAGVGALKSPYNGEAYCITNNLLGLAAGMDLSSTGGTKVVGDLGSLPITGKLTSAGKLTFSGASTSMAGNRKVTKGKAQLSANGLFLAGAYTFTGTGVFAQLSGNYIFEEATASLLLAEEAHAIPPPPSYTGATHDNKNEALVNETLHFAFTQPIAVGPFAGTFNSVPITGKIKANGSVTFKGTLKNGSSSLKVQGSAWLSGSHEALIGTFTAKGKGTFASETSVGTMVGFFNH